MDSHQIRHIDEDPRGSFVIERDGATVAQMTYSISGNTVIIEHTEVSDVLRGTGAGKALVEAVVNWARATGQGIMPLCPFARSVFERTPAYADVRR